MTHRLPLLLIALGTVTAPAASPPEDETLPGMELSGYLTGLVEGEEENLIDPLGQAEPEENAPHDIISYRDCPWRQTDQ